MNLKQLADLNRRLIVSGILIAIVFFLIIFSSHVVVNILLALTVAGIAGIGVWEYAQLAKAKDLQPAGSLMIFVSVAVVLAFFLSQKFIDWPQLPLVVIVGGAIAFFVFHFKEAYNSLIHVAVEFFGVCYVAVPLSFMLAILQPIDGDAYTGKWWLAYLIVVTKITDVGAYFTGRLWGKHKLAPVLSPKKTLEGAVAGFFSALIMSLVLAWLGKHFSGGSFELPVIQALWLGMVIGILGQIGDLAESLLKRDADVKDSNRLPGLGGILDMVDSLLLTAPIVYFFINF